MNKIYKVILDNNEIGTTRLEKADAPMGVVFGKIEFNNIQNPYLFIKSFCQKNEISVDDDLEDEFINTLDIPQLKVFREDGLEIKGVAGNSIAGMTSDGFDITILGIDSELYEEEFSYHVKEYNERWKKS